LIEATATKLSDKGASVVDVAFAPAFADILEDHLAISSWEGTRNYADERLRNPGKVSKELMEGSMKRGLEITLERYIAAQRQSVAFRAQVDSLFDKVDVLLCPSAPGEAPEGVEYTGDPRFNSIWTSAGTPCVTLPAGTGAKGLPLGIQLVGLRHEDDRLLSTAAWVAAHLS
jgi:Asp-tRNA(Asn)/Glu-tRNA(Gln) amidotransferase A subunit family amidase